MKKYLIIILMLIFTSVCTLPVAAVTLKSAQQQKSTISSRLTQLNKDKKRIQEEKKKLEEKKSSVTNAHAAESKEYKQLVSEINELETNIKEIDLSIEEAQNDYDIQRELLKSRLKVMYENSNESLLDMVVHSKSLTDLMEKLEYMSLISKNDKQLLEEISQLKKDIEFKKTMKVDEKEGLAARADQKKDRINTLKASRAEIDAQISKNKKELDKLEKQEDSLVEESNRLASVIKNLSKTGKKYSGGTMKWPVPSSYNVTSGYGMRYHPILHKNKFHTGIDIGAKKGVSIVAANSGTVIVAGNSGNGYGNMVVIDHGGGITTLYAHASKLLVSVGDEVKSGGVIAKIGSTGLSTGPHLHFEVRKSGKVTNPLNGYLSK